MSARIVRSHSFILAWPVERAFPMFTPEGERAWAEGWNPRYVHPKDGRTEAGMVFTTGHGGEQTIWTMTRHDGANGIVQYVRTTPGNRTAVVLVQCAALGPSRTRVTVAYTLTSLGEAGERFMREWSEENYRDYIEGWKTALEKVTPTS
ncbi:hypothetical protein BWI17_02450 [Betaproteobacteria bacterium GR16-43]|nr:hypothetical protein BWI17_02450 [Betaproteobacteria bacterium GR16-43]